jgi:glycosyltransferase involved in cell wall biosynthesis
MADREKSNASPLVSTIIPARDAEAHLSRAINSALAQTYSPLEVIVIDDNSGDNTSGVAAQYAPPVKVIRLSRSLGPGGARNVGIGAARGTYLAFLDADDEWLPEKIEKQIAIIEEAPDMTFVSSEAALVSDVPGAPVLVNQCRRPVTGSAAWKVLLAYPFVSTPTVLARRDAVLCAGGFDPALPIAEDQDLWIRLARLGQIGFHRGVLARVHDTPESVTKRRAREGAIFTLRVIARHIEVARAELSSAEIREIYVERYASLGRNAYESGAIMLGVRLLLHSIRLGHPVMPVCRYLITTSGIGRLVKYGISPGLRVSRRNSKSVNGTSRKSKQ